MTKICTFYLFPIALFTGLGEIELTDHERRILNHKLSDYLWQSGFSQSFLAWRRRLLYCASAFLIVPVVLLIYDLANQGVWGPDDKARYTTLGLCALFSGMISPLVSFVFTFVAAWFWTDFSRSRNFLVPGWILGLVLKLWPTLVPLTYIMLDPSSLESTATGILYALSVLPTYLELIAGLTLGTKHVYNFAPSPLTGAMVVLSAGFSIIIPFAVTTLVLQLIGNTLLLAGLLSLVVGPSMVVAMCSKFTAVTVFSSSESIIVSKRILLAALVLRMIGLFLILAWFITFSMDGIVFITHSVDGKMIEGLIPIRDLIGAIFQIIGNTMFQSVLWTDIIVHVARNDNVKIVKLESDLVQP